MKKLMINGKMLTDKILRVMKNEDGDQITGWLIVILLVVVVGAFFLSTYQDTIVNIWDAIVDSIYDTFGL